MSDAAPPRWVRKLSLPSGAWRCLVGLWGFARYQASGPTTVYPCRETLSAETGQSVHAVAKQLRTLAERGWIRRPGKRGSVKVDLAWLTPFGQDGPTRVQTGPSTDGSTPETAVPDPSTGRSGTRVQDGPQTFQVTSKELPTNVAGDAHATPPPSVRNRPPFISKNRAGKPLHTQNGPEAPPPEERETHEHRQAPMPGDDHRPRAVQVASGAGGASLPAPPAQAAVVHGVGDASTATPRARARHERLAAARAEPEADRADLSPELWELIAAHGYSMTAESRQWRKWMLGCIDSEDLDTAAVGLLLAERTRQGLEAPTKDRLWSWGASAKWRASVVRRTETSKFKPSAPGPEDYDFTSEDIAAAHYAGAGR